MIYYQTQKEKGPRSSEALILLWRECVRIELTMDLISPTTGFEDQEHHQAPSTPMESYKNYPKQFIILRLEINYIKLFYYGQGPILIWHPKRLLRHRGPWRSPD